MSVVSPFAAQASELCEGSSRTGLYLPTVLPEEDGWERIDEVTGSWSPADVFLEEGNLVIEADGHATALFKRRERVIGLAPAYRLEVEVSQTWQTSYGGWLKMGGYVGAVFQDRLLLVFGSPGSDGLVHVGVPLDPGDGSPSLDLLYLATVEREAFHTLELSAVRDGTVHLSVDGTEVGQVPWQDLPLIDHEAVQDLGDVLEIESDEAGVFFGGIGSRSEWKRVAYEICLPHNRDVHVTSTAPSDPGSVVLRGGTRQTLEGFERIGGTLTQVSAVHKSLDGTSEGVIVLSDNEQQVTFLEAGDDGTPRAFAAFDVPAGYVSQLRLDLSGMTIKLDGTEHPVRVLGAPTGQIKIIPRGGPIHVPEGEQVAFAVDFDLTASLKHTRGTGFALDSVIVTGETQVPATPAEPPWDGLPPHAWRPPYLPLPILPSPVPVTPPPFANPSAAWEVFEERFDVILLRDQRVNIDLDGDRLEFVPAMLFPGLDLDSWDGAPAFLGVMRLLSFGAAPDAGQHIGVQYGPDGTGGGQWTFVDITGGTIFPVPADGDEVPRAGGVEYSDLDPLPGSPWDPTDPDDPWDDPPDDPPELPTQEAAAFGPGRAKVIALVHGAMNMNDIHRLVREYWGFDFTAELLGVPGVDALHTFEHSLADTTTITRDEWSSGGFSDERFETIRELEALIRSIGWQLVAARALRAYSLLMCVTPPPVIWQCAIAALAHVRVGEFEDAREALLAELEATSTEDVRIGSFVYHDSQLVHDEVSGISVPRQVVMLTTRNGSLDLGLQARRVTTQVADFYNRLVTNVFPPAGSEIFDRLEDAESFREPQIYFVAHSAGSLALRYLLSRPEQALLGYAFTEADLGTANSLAGRTVAVISLQSTHEGSPAADVGVALQDEFPVRLADILVLLLRGELRPNLARAMLRLRAEDLGLGSPYMENATTPLWSQLNTGALAPHLCRRPAENGMEETLIPIYTLVGRTPSAGYFNDPDMDWENAEGWRSWLFALASIGPNVSRWIMRGIQASDTADELRRLLAEQGPVVARETVGLMLLDGTFSSVLEEHWGDPAVSNNPESLDVVRRGDLGCAPLLTPLSPSLPSSLPRAKWSPPAPARTPWRGASPP